MYVPGNTRRHKLRRILQLLLETCMDTLRVNKSVFDVGA